MIREVGHYMEIIRRIKVHIGSNSQGFEENIESLAVLLIIGIIAIIAGEISLAEKAAGRPKK